LADHIAIRQRALIAYGRRKPVSTLSDLERRRAFARASARAADGARNRGIELRTAEQLRALTASGHG
jgi:hypothetical protein